MAIVLEGEQSKLQKLICLLVTLAVCRMLHMVNVTSRQINICNLLCLPFETIATIRF